MAHLFALFQQEVNFKQKILAYREPDREEKIRTRTFRDQYLYDGEKGMLRT